MQTTNIEYLDYCWNFYQGCKNQEEGFCNLPCWAKAMAKRFHRSFEPQFHIDVFHQAIYEKNAHIGVCFTGDLFGSWVNPDMLTSQFAVLKDSLMLKVEIQRKNNNRFFFLTKRPDNYAKWGDFPDNAWIGASTNGGISLAFALAGLYRAKAKHKWLSFEPLFNPIVTEPNGVSRIAEAYKVLGIDWLVVGAQTKPYKPPERKWVEDLVKVADEMGIPIFLKNNLMALMDGVSEMRQDLPK